MFCAISGEPPKVPVVSRKSGLIYEQRLIHKYINENGKDPVTGDTLELDDLIEIKSSKYISLWSSTAFPIVRRGKAGRQAAAGTKDEIAFSKTTYQLEAVDEPFGDDYNTSSDTSPNRREPPPTIDRAM